jgi:hypothetical protein
MNAKHLMTTAILAACAAHSALADAKQGAFETTVSAQARFSSHDAVQADGVGQIADLGVLNAALAGNPATTTLRRARFDDLLSPGAGLGIEVAYAAGENFDPYLKLAYGELRGRNATLADLSSPGLAGPNALNASVGDWRSTDLDVGARYYLTEAGPLRPFVEGFVGANHSNALRASFSASAAGVDLGANTLLPSATRFSTGLSAGASYHFAAGSDFRFKLGADYIAAQRYQSAAYSSLGLSAVSMGGRQLNMAAELGLSYHM